MFVENSGIKEMRLWSRTIEITIIFYKHLMPLASE